MAPEEIPVSSRKHVETYHETITPRSQEDVESIVAALRSIAKSDKVTGKIQLNLKQGGVRSIDVERTEEKYERVVLV